MRWWYLALVAACGRWHFDAREVAGDGATLGDTGVLVDAVEPAACVAGGVEVCNGVDDDCNGIVDEGCPCTAYDHVLAFAGSSPPALAATGSAYLVLLDDGTTYSIAVLPADGSTGPTPTALGTHSAMTVVGGRDTFAWNGTQLAIAYTDTAGGAMFRTFDPGPRTLSAPTSFATAATSVRIVWAGDRYVAAWLDASNHPNVVELDANGAPLGAAHAVTATTYAIFDGLDVSESHIALVGRIAISVSGVVSIVDRTTYNAVNTSLQFGGYPLQITIVRGPNGFAAVSAGATAVVYFQAFAPTGEALAPAVQVPIQTTDFPSFATMVATPTRYRITAYTVPSFGTTHTLHAVDVDPTGTPVAGSTMLTTFTSGSQGYPSMIGGAQHTLVVEPQQAAATPLEVIERCN